MPDRSTITRSAHAKLNLVLSVGPPDKRGMHPIASWMAPLDLRDDVEVERLAGEAQSEYRIEWAADATASGAVDWPIELDLGVRAHGLLEEHAGRRLPIRLGVGKRIPAGGGLGGGSSDAAAVLTAVNELFSLGLGGEELQSLSTRLGSDVPFFVDPGSGEGPPRPAIVTGLGDAVERIDRIPSPVTLLVPPFGCPTGKVYGAYDRLGPKPLREPRVRSIVRRAVGEKQIPWSDLFNDLADPAASAEPRFGELLRSLRSSGRGPLFVSGSGSTLFTPDAGPFEDSDPGLRTIHCSLV